MLSFSERKKLIRAYKKYMLKLEVNMKESKQIQRDVSLDVNDPLAFLVYLDIVEGLNEYELRKVVNNERNL